MFWTQLKCTFPPCRLGAACNPTPTSLFPLTSAVPSQHRPVSRPVSQLITALTRRFQETGAVTHLPPPRHHPPPPPTPLLCQRQRVWHERCEVRARQPANNLSRRDGARSRPGSRYNGRRREEEVWRSTSTSTSPAAGLSVLTCQGFEGEMQASQLAAPRREAFTHPAELPWLLLNIHD